MFHIRLVLCLRPGTSYKGVKTQFPKAWGSRNFTVEHLSHIFHISALLIFYLHFQIHIYTYKSTFSHNKLVVGLSEDILL